MKTLSIALILLFFSSCTETSSNTIMSKAGNYGIRIIDGCEYITVENGVKMGSNYNYSITHKGNCKNPIHSCKCNCK